MREIHVANFDAPRALLDIHAKLQRSRLEPHEYTLIGLYLRYRDLDNKPVDSPFDLPACANPTVVKARRPKPSEQSLFAFCA